MPDSHPQPWAELTTITPTMAREWLERNTNNRNQRTVDDLARDIEHGSWVISGDTIKFDWNEVLLDGQHRLIAVVKTGKPITTFVVHGLDPNIMVVVDTGKKRNAGDVLKLSGHRNYTVLAGIARAAILWDEGVYKHAIQGAKGRRVTNTEIAEWATDPENADAPAAATAGQNLANNSYIPPTPAAFVALMLRRIDEVEAEDFYDAIRTLRTEGAGDPVSALLRRYRTAHDNREELRMPQHLYFLLQTWNRRRSGQPLHQLRAGDTGAGPGASTRIEIPEPK